VGLQFEDGGRLLPGGFDYDSFTVDARHYLRLTRHLVVANRLQLGDIRAGGSDPALVPFAKKYFLGGATSIRGWGRYEVSPLGTSHLPIGGNAMAAFSSEGRLAFSSRAGGVAFLDAGQVWTDARSVKLGDVRYAVGIGFRYQTPVGPLRLDLGYQLTPIPELLVNGTPQLRPWRLHFSIGQAF
jgi:outer membrane translocation and assembly module TamA